MAGPIRSKKQRMAPINNVVPVPLYDDAQSLPDSLFFKPIRDHNKFIDQLYDIVESAESMSIRWSDDGKKLIVTDIKFFADRVMPIYFGRAKFTSFRRRMSSYGFRKSRLDKEKNVAIFRHPLFQRDHPELRAGITRQQRRNPTISTNTICTDQNSLESTPLSMDTSEENSLTQSLSYSRLTDLSESCSMNTFHDDEVSEDEELDYLWDDIAYCV